jgi:hypothetical protein
MVEDHLLAAELPDHLPIATADGRSFVFEVEANRALSSRGFLENAA